MANPLVSIPPEELGPGTEFDFANNRIITASGKIYYNVQVDREWFLDWISSQIPKPESSDKH